MRVKLLLVFLLACGVIMMTDISIAQHDSYGILGQKAPSWGVSTWFNLDDGVESVDVSDFKGKVIYLYGFQSWCPGCHSHGFPTLQSVADHYRNNNDVEFVAVQTVFEGFTTNTEDSALETVQKFGLEIPVGHDAGQNGSGSSLMRHYRSGGTPWTVIIDADGIVQFNGFSIQPVQAVALIDRLLKNQG